MGASGQLPNAPLVYVLAAISHDRDLGTEQRVRDIQARLRDRFPSHEQQAINQIELSPGSGGARVESLVIHGFSNLQRSKGVVVSHENFVYHTTDYCDHQTFLNELSGVLAAVAQDMSKQVVRRLGLRYVDVITPSDGESPFQYVVDTLTGPKLDLQATASERTAQVLITYPVNDGALSVRFATGLVNQFLPSEIVPMLAPPKRVSQMQKSGKQVRTALLDFDRFAAAAELFDPHKLSTKFAEFRNDTSKAFHAVKSKHAETVWNVKPA